MPRYKVPKEKMEMANPGSVESFRPTVYFPGSKEQADEVSVGDSVEVLMKGKLVGMNVRDGSVSFDMELMETDLYSTTRGNEFDEMTKEEES